MRKADIAEWILSCTMPADRAAAIAGDLAEEDDSLWLAVASMCVSETVQQLTRAPLTLFMAAGFSWLRFLMAWILYAIAALGVWGVLYFLAHHTALELIAELPPMPFDALRAGVGWTVLPALAAWKIGSDMSKKTPGSEFALLLLSAIVWPELCAWAKLPFGAIPLVALLAGMLWARWLSVRARYRAA